MTTMEELRSLLGWIDDQAPIRLAGSQSLGEYFDELRRREGQLSPEAARIWATTPAEKLRKIVRKEAERG